MKRNVIENIVPIIVALKRKLAASKSSLMGNLMLFLRELMKDYKDEIQEILAEDRQLMAEIDFDLKRFEQQEKEEAALQSVASRQNLSVPPPELVAAREQEVAGPQPTARRSRMPNRTVQEENNVENSTSPEPAANSDGDAEINQVTIPKPTNPEVLSAPHTEEIHRPNDDVDKNSTIAETSQMAPPSRNVTKARLLRPRVMSTPIRNIPIDDVSFNIRDMDLSVIPPADPEPRKRKRL